MLKKTILSLSALSVLTLAANAADCPLHKEKKECPVKQAAQEAVKKEGCPIAQEKSGCAIKVNSMPLIGDVAPSFTAQSTQGEVNFPADYKGKWVVFFSHPADFTPVCTTEFMTFQTESSKFKALNTQLVGLSVDDLESHKKWLEAIKKDVKFKEMKDVDITFPLIDDAEQKIAKLYGMMHPDVYSTKSVRAVFVIDPNAKVRAILYYPQSTGRNVAEILRLVEALQTSDAFGVATPANWQAGDDVIVPPDKVPNLTKKDFKEQKINCHVPFLCTKPLAKEEVDKAIRK